eukprot:jgi/Botrbrau1/6179/Bobra.0344s0019.1
MSLWGSLRGGWAASRQTRGLLRAVARGPKSHEAVVLGCIAQDCIPRDASAFPEQGLVATWRLLALRGYAAKPLPPHSEIAMPALSPTMSHGNLARWNKAEGEAFKVGEVLADIETDKATLDMEAMEEGVLAKILIPAGTKDVAVGTPVAIVVEEPEQVAAFKDYVALPTPAAVKQASPDAASPAAAPEPGTAGGRGANFPPHTVMGLPALSPTMVQGNIDWKKKEGDKIGVGEVLADVETDKATMDWDAQDEGYVAKILVPSGTRDIAVGSPVLVVVEDEELVPSFAGFTLADVKGAKVKAPPKAAPAEGTAPPASRVPS